MLNTSNDTSYFDPEVSDKAHDDIVKGIPARKHIVVTSNRDVLPAANTDAVRMPTASNADEAYAAAWQRINTIRYLQCIAQSTEIRPVIKLISCKTYLEGQWMTFKWNCEGSEHREWMPKDGNFAKYEERIQYIDRNFVKHWEGVRARHTDGDGNPVKEIHVREAQCDSTKHWVGRWCCPVSSCTCEFDKYEEFLSHMYINGIQEQQAEKLVCAVAVPADHVEGLEKKR